VPTHDVVRNLVYSADGGSVKTVIVDGRIILRERVPLIDEARLLDQAREVGEQIAQRTGLLPRSKWPRV
jgi:5-methylthioadenosine/S-adenosylhomocysteine deaminase